MSIDLKKEEQVGKPIIPGNFSINLKNEYTDYSEFEKACIDYTIKDNTLALTFLLTDKNIKTILNQYYGINKIEVNIFDNNIKLEYNKHLKPIFILSYNISYQSMILNNDPLKMLEVTHIYKINR